MWQLGLSCVRAHLCPRGAGGAGSPHKQLPPPEGPVISHIPRGSSNLRAGAGRRVLGRGPPDAQGSLVPTAPLGSLRPMQLCGAAARGETQGSGDPSPITGSEFRARAGAYMEIPSCTSWGPLFCHLGSKWALTTRIRPVSSIHLLTPVPWKPCGPVGVRGSIFCSLRDLEHTEQPLELSGPPTSACEMNERMSE